MLSILGLGASHPATSLSNEFLLELGLGVSPELLVAESGVSTRWTTLPLEYIRSTRNDDVSAAPRSALCSPTDLALEAAQMALLRAGVTADQLGLIIGDCSTPYQTTPSEAQRLGQRLGVKIPAYDVTANSGALCVHLETLLGWKEDRIPEYTLLVSANTPTQCIDYRTPGAPALFGDGAGALVVSNQKAGRCVVRAAVSDTGVQDPSLLSIPTYGHLRYSPTTIVASALSIVGRAIEFAKAHDVDPTRALFVLPCMAFPSFLEAASKMSIAPSQIVATPRDGGDTLGSSPTIALSAIWDSIERDSRVIVVQAGFGLGFGCVLIDVVG